MYKTFFGLKEKPFKLVPDPSFLFLGKSHEEALAHLTYAATQGDGFVEISGEVGTGKTTLCRVFLENLGPNVEAAFIFNTNLNALGLLRAINSEFGIKATAGTPTELIETLNGFLVEKCAQGRSVILLIDEAQNLDIETLEQVRMLSNLETTKNKLLQIILVGQPELGKLLHSRKLRQLGQRINLSCNLMPMSLKETRDYISHRVDVASDHTASEKKADLFTQSAKNAVYKYSGGIPRLINIACDRALVAAYSLNQPKVTYSLAKLAIKELLTRGENLTRQPPSTGKVTTAAIITLGIAIIAFFYFSPAGIKDLSHNHSKVKAAAPKIKEAQELLVKTEPGSQEPASFPSPEGTSNPIRDFLADHAETATRKKALAEIVFLWKGRKAAVDPLISEIPRDRDFFRVGAFQEGLEVILAEEDFPTLETLNLPLIIPFVLPAKRTKGFLAVVGITDDNKWIIAAGDRTKEFRVAPEELSPFLTKETYIVYKERLGYKGIISRNSPATSVINLKLLLRKLGFTDIRITPEYDEELMRTIKEIQADNNLNVDGLTGPMTKIVLYNKKNSFSTPLLRNHQQ